MEINRTLFQQYPLTFRNAYSIAVRETKPDARHHKMCQLGEIALAYFTSLTFSNYRSRYYNDPNPKVESVISRLNRISLGQYLEVFRVAQEATQPALFDAREGELEDHLDSCARFNAAVAGIEDSIMLEAGNLRRVVSLRLDQPYKKIGWLTFWEAFVAYRNRAEGHSATYNWPVAHPHYYEIMCPIIESALIEAITAPHVKRILDEYSVAELLDVRYESGAYFHVFTGDDTGLPFTTDIKLDRGVTDIWNIPEWRASKGNSFMLTRTPSGSYDVYALMHDFLCQGAPIPIDTHIQKENLAQVIKPSAENSTSPWRTGTASAAGTCGEFVQGISVDGQHFHVTCPVQKSSTVCVRVRKANETKIEGAVATMKKLHLSIIRTIEYFNLPNLEVHVDHWSDLDIGKGMGSSTADIVAACRALAIATDQVLTPDIEAKIATSVESSDGLMYPGIVAFEQKTGKLIRRYNWWPQYIIVMIIPPNVFNTESANFDGKEKSIPAFVEIMDELDQAVQHRDVVRFAKQVTRSAELNQRFVPNFFYQMLISKLDEYGAVGINVGHTGTVAGLLFEHNEHGIAESLRACSDLQQQLPRDVRVEITSTPPSPE